MPARKSSESSGTNDSAAAAEGATADDAVSDAATEEEAVPLNRAERRAKGRKTGGVPTTRSTLPGKGQTFQSPRQWSNRRGGG